MMWPSLFTESTLPALEQTVQFAERRHALLAGNVANADTPGYQQRDLSVEDFQRSLKEAVEAASREKSSGIDNDSAPRTDGLSHQQAMKNVRESMKQILYHDGSDVGLESQVTEIAKNQSMHTTAVSVMRHQFNLLKMAISQSVNV
jgi:flagellar basal-body rod protein FlgB